MDISFCINPECSCPHQKGTKICPCCGFSFLLAGRYQIEAPRRSGGFARTFSAVDEQLLQSPCIVKQFHPYQLEPNDLQKAIELFNQEAVLLCDLGHHPQIPSLLAYFEEGGYLYLVQEYLDGQDLFEDLTLGGPYSEDKIWQLLSELLPVLQFIHEKQVIHRDIKPSNIIRRRTGSFCLIDFGSSFQLGGAIWANSGTPGYASPEQMQGLIYPSSDLYSLGVLCIRLLTGCLPSKDGFDPLFQPEACQWLWRQTGISVSAQLEYILNKLLQSNIERRFQSADEVLTVLNQSSKAADISFAISQHPISLPKFDIQPSQSSMSAQPSIILASETGLDYSTLQRVLAAQMFKEADEETLKLMLKITHCEERGYFSIKSILEFPYTDLSTIDRLWKKYSDGHFGFSVQQQIYQGLGGTISFNYSAWRSFGECVGWFLEDHWLDYSSLIFDRCAPAGHLPAACFTVVNRQDELSCNAYIWWRLGYAALMTRLSEYEFFSFQS